MKWKLCTNEMERAFLIVDEQGLPVAYPATVLSHQTAQWNKKTIRPLALWKQFATDHEQETARLICAAPELFALLKKAHRFLRKGGYAMEEINEVLDYIIGANDGRTPTT